MSKVISCFGCSFTGGVLADTEPRESWPYRLSLARPDLKVYNFGRQATSALFSLNMIDQVSEQLKSDLVITSSIVSVFSYIVCFFYFFVRRKKKKKGNYSVYWERPVVSLVFPNRL